MDALRSAVPLARVLFKLAERRKSVTVRVRASGKLAELSLVAGYAVALHGVDGELLGDALLRKGALDTSRHYAALSARPARTGPVGRWLVDVGAASREAVRTALGEQLRERIGALLRFRDADITLAPPRAYSLELRTNLSLSVWNGLLALAEELPASVLHQLSGDRALTLSPFGYRLVQELECAGVHLDDGALLSSRPPESLCCARAVFRVLGALNEHTLQGESYSLLLRKRGEIQRNEGAARLLDLREPVKPEQARRAFRRLAAQLHPDRFERERPELRALSSEVMRALSHAEAALRKAR